MKLLDYIQEFTPSNILKLDNEELRYCQISRQKATYLKAIANAVINDNLSIEQLKMLDEPEIRNKLTSIKGIGDWTSDIYLMFCLQSRDIFPIGDFAVVNSIKELTTAKTREEIQVLAHTWKPYRSLATYFLWHYYFSKRNRSSLAIT